MPYGQVEVGRVYAFVRLFVCSFVRLFVLPSDPDGVKQISQYYRGMATGRVNTERLTCFYMDKPGGCAPF